MITNIAKAWDAYLKSSVSQATNKKHERENIRFFNMVLGKEPNSITGKDLNSLNYGLVVKKFIAPLRDESKIKQKTIKNYLKSVKNYISFLDRAEVFEGQVDFYKILDKALYMGDIKANDGGHNTAISRSELRVMQNWFENKKFQTGSNLRGKRFSLLVDFMFKTGVRSTAVFNIKWSDFTIGSSAYGGDWAILKVKDKGNKFNTKPISRDYYERLKKLFYVEGEELVFNNEVSQKALQKQIEQFNRWNCKENGVDITYSIHSFKKGGATTLYNETHDLIKVRDFCDHKSVATTEIYIDKSNNPNDSGSGYFTSTRNLQQIWDLPKSELKEVIQNNPSIENALYNALLSVGKIK